MEQWRAITGFEGYYEVSNQGHVRSLNRTVKYGRWGAGMRIAEGRILKPQTHHHDYVKVALSKNGQYRCYYIHILVARAFVPVPACLTGLKIEVNHKEGPSNDAMNLEWRTHQGNQQHGAKNNLMCGDGVYFNKTRKKWIAQYSPTPNHQKNLGGFDTHEEAKAVRDAAVKYMSEVV